jgi:hypothetical protein
MSRIKIGGNRGTKGRAAASQNRAKQADARAAHLAPIIARLRGSGIASLYGIARALSALAIPTPNGRKKWQGLQVQRVLAGATSPWKTAFPDCDCS